MVAQPVKKLPPFFETLKFITSFRKPHKAQDPLLHPGILWGGVRSPQWV